MNITQDVKPVTYLKLISLSEEDIRTGRIKFQEEVFSQMAKMLEEKGK